MAQSSESNGVQASCHCGAVTLDLAAAPTEVTQCNCSLCRRYGVLWAYYSDTDLVVHRLAARTQTYSWNGRHVDFHRCAECGCLTHWEPRDAARKRRGVNARLLDPDVLAAATVRHLDGANTGKYLD